jgi:peptide/nickel transport system permease protein
MLAEGRNLLFANPVATLAPGAMIAITATATNLIGDWLYELLSSRGAMR